MTLSRSVISLVGGAGRAGAGECWHCAGQGVSANSSVELELFSGSWSSAAWQDQLQVKLVVRDLGYTNLEINLLYWLSSGFRMIKIDKGSSLQVLNVAAELQCHYWTFCFAVVSEAPGCEKHPGLRTSVCVLVFTGRAGVPKAWWVKNCALGLHGWRDPARQINCDPS